VTVVKLFQSVGRRRHSLNQLLQKTRKEVFNRLFVLPPEIAIEVCDAGILGGVFAEVVDHDRRKNRLSRSGNAWAEQRLASCLEPSFELWRVQEPLASSWLSSPEIVALLGSIVNWREPVEDFKIFFSVQFVPHCIDIHLSSGYAVEN